MSFEYYSQWWAATRENLERLAEKDEAIRLQLQKKPQKSRVLANQLFGGLYAKYSLILQDLGTILDQIAQPQKRETIRKIMDVATVRFNEINNELRGIMISEYHYIDGSLIELKLVPQNVEILDPIFYYLRHYTVEELWTKIKNGEPIYTPPPPPPPPPELPEGEETPATTDTEAEAPPPAAAPAPEPEAKAKKRPKKFVQEVVEMTQEEKEAEERKVRVTAVVLLIQTMERGRQARSYFLEKFKQHQFKKFLREGHKPVFPDPKQVEQSTLMIEKLWRGHAARQLMRRKEKERRLLIGMTEPSWTTRAEFEKLEANLQKRRVIRDQRIKEYIEAHLNERARVFRVIGPRLMEDISDEIREWFHQWYTQVKNFDKYPTEEKGGTVLVVRGETMTPKEWIDDVERKRREKAKNKGKDKAKLKAEKEKAKKLAKEKKKKEAEKRKKEAARKRKKKLKPMDYELEPEPTAVAGPFPDVFHEYRKLWSERKDEDNPEEKHYMDIIHEEKCWEMQLELRKVVDEMMRLELELLDEALLKDRAKAKGKKYKKKKQKKKKKKKKGKRGKKDPTGHRTLEDLFQELVDNGIIHPYKKALLSDYIGDFSYANWELRNHDFDPPPCLGDVRQVVKMNCIVPLSTTSMKKHKSVLIMGPRQSGKHLLANIIFNETQSVLFDLSPHVVAGKYEGKKGMKMLLHLINKMSRLLQPSIIFFDGAEKLFYKKVPAAEKPLDPKRMGKKLLKGIVKPIKPEDRVMVLGISGTPWLGKPAKLKKTFERIILLPRPDYGTIYLYWRQLLMPFHGVDRNFNVSALAKVTKFFTLPDIKRAVDTVFVPRRIVQLHHKPLTQAELYEVLINTEPISDKEMNKFYKIYKKTPLGWERGIFNKFAEVKREQERKAMEKAKQKAQQQAKK